MGKILIVFGLIFILGCAKPEIVDRWSVGKVINVSYVNSTLLDIAKTTVVTDVGTYLVAGSFLVKRGSKLEVVQFKDKTLYLSGGDGFNFILGY